MLTLSEMDIDSLLQNGSLSINKPINWKMKDSHYKFSVPIEGKNSLNHHKIELVGTKNPRTIHYTLIAQVFFCKFFQITPQVS